MNYIARIDSDQVVSLTCLREFASRWKEMCGDWLSDDGAVRLQQAIDDLDTVLELATPVTTVEAPALHSVHADRWPT